MNAKHLLVTTVVFVSVVSLAGAAMARGFGGHGFGGGVGGGSFRGGMGGFGGGDFRGSMGGYGGDFRGGVAGGDFGGLRSGFNAGDFRPSGGFSQNLSGLRSGGLDGQFRNQFGNIGTGNQFRSNPGGNGFASERFGNLSNQFARPNRDQLNNFLGLPSDAGMNHIASGADGSSVHHGTYVGPRGGTAHGGYVVGPRGNKAGRGIYIGPNGGIAGAHGVKGAGGHGAASGFAVGPNRNFAAGFRTVNGSVRHTTAVGVRRNYHGYGIYGPYWWHDCPGCWHPHGWGPWRAWTWATWTDMGLWFALAATQPVYYDYGTNVVYDNNNVYVNNQDVGTAEQYYQSAQQMAEAGAQATPADDTQWMPLGVFALVQPDQTTANLTLQLAVDKQGVLRGNYTDLVTKKTLPVHGEVNEKTQRVAWTVGDNKSTVFETGLYNLTKDEAPALVHFGKDRTQQWLLVRLNKDDKPETGDAGEDSTAPSTGPQPTPADGD